MRRLSTLDSRRNRFWPPTAGCRSWHLSRCPQEPGRVSWRRSVGGPVSGAETGATGPPRAGRRSGEAAALIE